MKQTHISRRDFMKTLAAVGITAATPGCLAPSKYTDASRPNIILIMADDLGYECIGANGGTSYKTPVIDKMAEKGIRFEHCYSQPLCTPSRVQIMTGIYNVRNYVKFRVLDRSEVTFGHLLKRQGYATCISGKWQLGRQTDSAGHFGFDESCLWQHTRKRTDKEGHDTRYSNPRLEINGKKVNYTKGEYGPEVASDFICDFIERHKGKPFFAYYPMILTHCPFVPTPDSADWDPANKGSKEYKGDAKYFGDMVSYMDKLVGKIIAKLDKLGLREKTLILFTGDNGTDEPVVSVMNGQKVKGAKGKTTDAGTRVPLIANGPGVIGGGQVSKELVDFSDFVPTICETAGVTVPEALNIDGRSFLPQLKGRKGNPREWIYCWYSRDGDDKKAKVFARNHRYKRYRDGKLYDISKDVLEKTPLGNGDLNDEAIRIRAMLQSALDKYKDKRF